jgi:putative DNA primase/helicase
MHSEKITDRAKGKWKRILPALGLPAKLMNGRNQPCPFCGGKDRFRFTDHHGLGCYICSQCGNGTGFDLLIRLKGWTFKTAAEEVEKVIGACRPITERGEADKRKAMNDLWERAQFITESDPAGMYLRHRCGLAAFPASLRYVSSLRYFGSPESYPAMLARLTKPDNKPCNIHRTYLTADGHKAPVEAPRRMMPGTVASGSAVRLAPSAPIMGIAEGLETALSAAALFNVPTWAALNAGGLKSWEPPEGVLKVMIFGDNDENYTGQEAAFALARRLSNKGIATEVKIPEQVNSDWNDIHARNQQHESAA